MTTECTQVTFEFHGRFERKVTAARFDGGTISSDAGALLLREVEKRTGLLAGFAGCFRDRRVPLRRLPSPVVYSSSILSFLRNDRLSNPKVTRYIIEPVG